ncbi:MULTISPECIES: hypothetical protein [Halobacterium]|uniref:Small CPxCG-related zinc finger protein n=4 Tax=Halobacterium salinarum TaxID=2242 RepID=Q9HP04_HALSA|nr:MULTISPECIES: hypothetical protein [Halobacterium]AAG20066.1 hypothetical protein VNG_1865H [Halobacterium salinarum NRC-1]MBB6089076.1 ribosomal protein L44E [Halobacterium salinarum]MCF2166135.1 hypothetical protein [Halobacterium salinarum]MCF2167618.1 hypothetical protein [Halobacterium salinarum]MCF2207293.1 hypothetical protein [Halobacterium salinarum]
MASKTPGFEGVTEYCERCGQTTTHQVAVELRTENTNTENAAFSREPYRVATCCECDAEHAQRMNNA